MIGYEFLHRLGSPFKVLIIVVSWALSFSWGFLLGGQLWDFWLTGSHLVFLLWGCNTSHQLLFLGIYNGSWGLFEWLPHMVYVHIGKWMRFPSYYTLYSCEKKESFWVPRKEKSYSLRRFDPSSKVVAIGMAIQMSTGFNFKSFWPLGSFNGRFIRRKGEKEKFWEWRVL